VLFFASYADHTIPVQRISSLEASHVSFCKIIVTMSRSIDLKKFKWVLISEDSAFVVLEVRFPDEIVAFHFLNFMLCFQNLRKLVAPLDHNSLYYLVSSCTSSLVCFSDTSINNRDVR
jgi:hypothetical protein